MSSGTLPTRLRRALSRRVLASVAMAAMVTTAWVLAVAPPVIVADAPGGAPASRPPASPPDPPASVTTIAELPADPPAPASPVAFGMTTDGPTRVSAALAAILLEAYRNAVAGAPAACHLPVSLLAAIGEVESGSLAGRKVDEEHRSRVLGPVLDGDPFARVPDTDGGWLDGNPRWDRALGPMQILPATWVRFATDGDHDDRLDPQDLDDAAATAASYLCAHGRDLSRPAELRAAVLAYNHSTAYLKLVLTLTARYQAAGLDRPLPSEAAVATAALQLSATPVPTGTPAPGGVLTTGPTPDDDLPVALPAPTSPLRAPSAGSDDEPTSSPSPTSSSPSTDPTPAPQPTGSPTESPTDSPAESPTGTPSGTPSPAPEPPAAPSAPPTCDDEPATGPTVLPKAKPGKCPPGKAARPWDERPGNRRGQETTPAPSG